MDQSGRSLASDKAIAPVPVPKSTIRASSGKSKCKTVSTKTSVSGRGTKVSLVTFKSKVQNGCEPVT
ncbi:hypothetical protein D9M72_313110 [compost metagenome]